MRLRAQVMLVGLATLAVPVLGWQSVRQLHVSLQDTRIDAQALAVANLRASLAGSNALAARLDVGASGDGASGDGAGDWYAESAPWPLFIDGYADDWQELVGGALRYPESGPGDAALALRVARRGGELFLFVSVRDDRVVHHVPPRLDADAGENERPDPESLRVNGDALELYVRPPGGVATHALLSVIAPGPVTVVRAAAGGDGRRRGNDARAPERPIAGWRAEWVDARAGYQVEVRLPLPPAGSAVGIAAIDVDRTGGPRDAWVGSVSPAALRGGIDAPARLHHESTAVRGLLRPWVAPGTRARLYDAAGRLLADVDALYASRPAGEEPSGGLATGLLDAILFRLFAWFAAGDLPLLPETEKTRQPLHLDAERRRAASSGVPTTRYVTVDNDRVLGTLVALGDAASPRGYLLFESNEEHASRFTSSRLARLFALLVLASLAVAALLFGWATRVSLRIARLSREASRAVDADGRVTALAGHDARDEIGELSRDLSALLARSAAYTRYLEALSARLSHELGTPLSVVRTSLENVDTARLDAESATLVARAGGGAERLGGIVRALIDSTRLEQSVQHASFASLELSGWLREAAEEYAQILPEHRVRVVGPSAPVNVRASAALLRQALDKLVSNARDFATTPDIEIRFGVTRRGTGHGAAQVTGPGAGRGTGAGAARADGGTGGGGGRGRGARVTIGVANRGPAIDGAARTRLFDASHTGRAGEGLADEAAHAGLGLHVVGLVAEAHGGETFARDVDGGVVIGLVLPLRRGEGRSSA